MKKNCFIEKRGTKKMKKICLQFILVAMLLLAGTLMASAAPITILNANMDDGKLPNGFSVGASDRATYDTGGITVENNMVKFSRGLVSSKFVTYGYSFPEPISTGTITFRAKMKWVSAVAGGVGFTTNTLTDMTGFNGNINIAPATGKLQLAPITFTANSVAGTFYTIEIIRNYNDNKQYTKVYDASGINQIGSTHDTQLLTGLTTHGLKFYFGTSTNGADTMYIDDISIVYDPATTAEPSKSINELEIKTVKTLLLNENFDNGMPSTSETADVVGTWYKSTAGTLGTATVGVENGKLKLYKPTTGEQPIMEYTFPTAATNGEKLICEFKVKSQAGMKMNIDLIGSVNGAADATMTGMNFYTTTLSGGTNATDRVLLTTTATGSLLYKTNNATAGEYYYRLVYDLSGSSPYPYQIYLVNSDGTKQYGVVYNNIASLTGTVNIKKIKFWISQSDLTDTMYVDDVKVYKESAANTADSVLLLNASGNSVTDLDGLSSLTVKAGVKRSSYAPRATTQPIQFITAIYDNKNLLKKIDTYIGGVLLPYATEQYQKTIDLSEFSAIDKTGWHARVFIWDSIVGLKPLFDRQGF